MRNPQLDFRYVLILCYCFFSTEIYAQLGFCQGNSGDPIFTENFGTGSVNNSLPAGTTTYNFTGDFPDDGFYTVSNGSFGNPFDWHEVEDHTPDDTDGKFLIINADFVEGEFYRTTITGLCERTTYEFSAWLLNLLKVSGLCVQQNIEIPINVSFQIWDSTDTNLLASGDTGDIFATENPTWGEFGLVFQTLEDQNSVILKMLNNGQGGCGNDLAIDDIEFKSCGDSVIVVDESNNTSVTICEDETPYTTVLSAVPDFSVFNSHFYQWQESADGMNWTDISGETTENLSVTTSSSGFFRAKVAEFAENLSNDQCILLSEVFQITVNLSPDAPISNGDVLFNCNLNEALLEVSVPNGISVNWYDSPADGNLLAQSTTSFTTNAEGVFYAEAVDDITGCISISRTEVNAVIVNPVPPSAGGDVGINCETNSAELIAFADSNSTINWYDSEVGGNLLATGDTLIVSEVGTYYAEAVDQITGCVSSTRIPVSVLEELEFGECIIPQGISPNVSPGLNDSFDLSSFGVTQIKIFNRHGVLVYSRGDYTDEWRGQTNDGEELPVGTYFYTMIYRNGTQSRSGWVYLNN
ncbi:gliding motility-associated C-terminal domain-containing protein [Winogradskyella tangerina]|uniref:gliding motility-associated C-terminal domain-containing protein n=1 Tax=Winogradskyella tangerina TaxID=2023240 RepID=UPI000DBE4CCA|nr:gliding motility-associated C-terminal domain-containing protein [Winogradskyella tangerina]